MTTVALAQPSADRKKVIFDQEKDGIIGGNNDQCDDVQSGDITFSVSRWSTERMAQQERPTS